MSDKPLKTHAGCGGKLTKEISAAGFQFKGTGWYVTDYARKSQPESKDSREETKETKSEPAKEKDATPAAKETSTEKKSEKPAKGKTRKS
jgi:predicted nucleic acid-binding Zn ribbon protein